MKQIIVAALTAVLSLLFIACGMAEGQPAIPEAAGDPPSAQQEPASAPDEPTAPENPTTDETEDTAMPKLQIEAGGQTFTATLLDNSAARALLDCLPMTVSMTELNGNEKYYYMSDSLPVNSQRPGNIHAGDLMLYGSDCLVLFYESFSSGYSYTRLGSIDDPSGLAAALGGGNVEVTFQIE